MKKYILLFTLLLPYIAWANDSGSCGENATYIFDENTKTITISGTGEMDDYSSTSVPWYYYNNLIEHVIIESGITSIGHGAFSNCPELSSIELPEGLVVIGPYALQNCPKLTEVVIPNSVTHLGTYSLASTGITSIVIPSNVSQLGGFGNVWPYGVALFDGCNNLQSIIVAPGNSTFDSRDNCNAIIRTETNTLVQGCGASTIPASVTSLGMNCFSGFNAIDTINIPEGVLSVSYYAFRGCSNLKYISLPQTIQFLGDWAFAYCPNIEEVYCKAEDPSKIMVPMEDGYVKLFDNSVYESASLYVPKASVSKYKTATLWSKFHTVSEPVIKGGGLIYVIENGKAVVIGRSGDYHDVVISDSITINGNKYQVTVEKGLQYNGRSGAFYEDDGIYSYTDPYITTLEHADAGGLCFNAVNLRKAICVSLTTLGGGWETDNRYCAFAGCSALEEVVFPNLSSIGDMAMMGCTVLKAIDFPKLTRIDPYAFASCGIKTANLPAVTTVGNLAFKQCDSLESVILDNVATIGSDNGYSSYIGGAFYNCKSLKSINLPNIVSIKSRSQYYYDTQLGNFQGCDSLYKVELGEKCERIDRYTFKDCDTLSEIYSYAIVPPALEETAFDNKTYENATLYVHAAGYQAYKNDISWGKFKNIKTLEPLYKLTYLLENEVYKEIETCEGDVLTAEPPAVKEGYTFSGWIGEPAIMPSKDTIINGYFTINKYEIVYYVDAEKYDTDSVEYNAPITAITAPVKEGYTFLAWMNLPNNMPAHDLAIDAVYSVNSYTLTFKIGDETIQQTNVEYGTTILVPNAPTKEGMTFDRWENLPLTMPAKDTTIVGVYKLNVYTITYIVDDEVLTTAQVEYSTVITPPTSEREGFTISWNAHPTTMPAYDITIYGNYVNTGVMSIGYDDSIVGIYSIDGTPLSELKTGINLIRYKNGSVRKVVVR